MSALGVSLSERNPSLRTEAAAKPRRKKVLLRGARLRRPP